MQTLKNRLAAVDPNGHTTQLELVQQENSLLRSELAAKDELLQELSDKVRPNLQFKGLRVPSSPSGFFLQHDHTELHAQLAADICLGLQRQHGAECAIHPPIRDGALY